MNTKWLRQLLRKESARGVVLVGVFLLVRSLWLRRRIAFAACGFLLALLGAASILRWQSPVQMEKKTPAAQTGTAEPGMDGTAAPFYTVTDLGTLGGKDSYAFAINGKGEVAGDSYTPDKLRGFLWRNGEMLDLGSLKTGSEARGVNDKSQVVGGSNARAFLWQDGKMRDLGALSGGKYSHATSINNNGAVAGSAGVGNYEGANAILWRGGKIKDLGRLPGGRYSLGLSINNKGQVVGYGHNGEYWGNFAIPRAFLWDEKNGMREIGTLGGGENYNDSFAHAINDKGQIVGVSNWRAFLWQDGKMQDLGTLPGHKRSRANAINNKGQVVGIVTDPGHEGMFLWQNGKMYDLNTLIPPDSGWVLSGAYGINDTGQIVGGGRHNGEVRAFLLTPSKR